MSLLLPLAASVQSKSPPTLRSHARSLARPLHCWLVTRSPPPHPPTHTPFCAARDDVLMLCTKQASLLIQSASNLTLQAENGPGSVQLWFSIGSGILVNQSSDVTLDGLSVDYDPPAHFQGTVVGITDDGSSSEIQAVVKTDPGFLDPATFDAQYREGMPGVQTGPAALVWNSSDPGFGAYAGAAWPPASAADGVHHVFNLSRAEFCTGIQFTTTDGTSCLDAAADTQARKSLDASNHRLQLQDKITAHIRIGYTLHLLNSSHVHTQHTSIHGAPGFAITEYDGYGKHSYYNVSLGRRHRTSNQRRAANSSMHANDAAMCGVANPTGGRLCLGLIASNNDALHSSGCKHGPSFVSGELSYCMDDWVNIHSRVRRADVFILVFKIACVYDVQYERVAPE